MSSDKNLQAMEEDVKQSKTAVNANAAPAQPMEKLSTGGTAPTVEDLGGPTPENYKPDDNSAKLKDAAGTLKQVRDVVNKKAVKAEEVETSEEVIEEEETTTDEVVAEEETTTEEVVSEEETTEEEVVAEAPDYTEIDIEEDVTALVEGEELSEDFKNKAKTILEAAIKGKVTQIKESLESGYEKKLVEEVEEIKGALNERVDSYLEYVAEEWFTENQLAVEGGLKEELTESFMTGLKSLFEEHYVSIPEEKYDVLNSMVEKLDEMENKLNEQIDRNVALNRRLAESTADVILADITEGLADTQREKLASLAENVEFESESDYREKLVKLKEAYFPVSSSAPKSTSENLSEEVSTDEVISEEVNPTMQAYLNTLSRAAKK